jgi:hypothetical protein
LLTAAGLTAAAAGCGGATNALSVSASVCFRALPVARHAVEDRGTLDGVRLIDVVKISKEVDRKLRRPRPSLGVAIQNSGEDQLCAFAFRGGFLSSEVVGHLTNAKGEFALVLVGAKHLKLIASVVLSQLPQRFSHPHIQS